VTDVDSTSRGSGAQEGRVTGVGGELRRKAVHIGMGGCAFLLRWLTPLQAAMLALVALLFNLLLLHRLTRGALLRPAERSRDFSWGIALYPAVVLALIVVFRDRLELAAAVWGLLAFGDGMATVSGVLLGGPGLPWNRDKTWSGFLAFVVYGTATSALLVRWTQRAVLEGSGAADAVGSSFLARDLSGAVFPDAWFLFAACLAAALAAAFAESLDTGLDDNLIVPLVGGAVLYAAAAVQPALLIDGSSELATRLGWGVAVNAALAVAAYLARGVTRSGAFWGWVLGSLLYAFSGWRGFSMLLAFFVLGTLCTRLGYADKKARGLAQSSGGRRGARNAFANATAGVVCAFLAAATQYPAAFTIAMVAAFATATFDTVSSEIGQAYGRRHYLSTTFRRVAAGTEGAVSLEGTLAGLLGAALLACAAWSMGLAGPVGAAAIVAGAFIGATFESLLGAAFHGARRVDNELINLANTAVGALTAGAIYALAAAG
jgi:uncharacterized protein (TIGR00297 family)